MSTPSPISFGGLISGLSTDQIVKALTSAYQQPIDALKTQQKAEQTKISAYQDLNVKINALQSAASSLMLQGTVGAKTLTFGGAAGSYATGSATASAVAGSFQLEIDQLATATKVTSTTNVGSPILTTDTVIGGKTATPVVAGTFTVNGQAVTVSAGEDFQTLFTAINTATTGAVSASISGDAIQLTSASPITLGAVGDTSNFLTVANLAGQPSSTTMTSSRPVGVVNTQAILDSANLTGLTSTTTGSLNINGVTIAYNTTVDTLADVINRINSSTAGVTATYDPNSDKVTLSSRTTGNLDITVADSGTLTNALQLSSATHALGQSASYRVDGGPVQYSLTNSVNNVEPGVNLTLTAPTPSGSPITVNVTQDVSSATASVQTFVSAYNAVVDLIATDTSYDQQTKQTGVLFGDPAVQTIQGLLNSSLFISNGLAQGLTPPYTDLSTIGLSTGAVGSPVGSTTDLTFDTAKFASAVSANPAGVTNLVTTIFSKFNTMTMQLTAPGGALDAAVQAENSIIQDESQRITFQTNLLQQQVAFYNLEFSQMETMLAQLQSSSSAAASILAGLGANTSSSTSGGSGANSGATPTG